MMILSKKKLAAGACLFANLFGASIVLSAPGIATGTAITLGNQDFNDGSTASIGTYNPAQLDEDLSLHAFTGADTGGPNFSKTFSFTYAPGTYTSASLSFGLVDYDCFSPSCNVVGVFTIDGVSFAAALLAQMLSTGQTINAAYDVFTLDLSSVVGLLGDGAANITLGLQAPPSSNGAGLDFATLDLSPDVVPEPATLALLGIGLAGLGFSRRRTLN